MDVEDLLYNEKKNEEDRENIIRRLIEPKKERKRMKELKKRYTGKGGAMAVMEKGWYEEKIK